MAKTTMNATGTPSDQKLRSMYPAVREVPKFAQSCADAMMAGHPANSGRFEEPMEPVTELTRGRDECGALTFTFHPGGAPPLPGE